MAILLLFLCLKAQTHNTEAMISIHTFTFNHFGQNTYLVYDDTKEAAVIDPGCFFEEEKQALLNFLKEKDLKLTKILFTHCHLDHAFGANFVNKQFPDIPIIGHEEENIFITEADKHAQRFGLTMEQPPTLTQYIKHGDTVTVGSSSLLALHVPGHSPGSICFYSEEAGWVVVGDVLFQNSIGRTDLHGGNYEQLISHIKKHLLNLPGNTVVYPGHGPATSIGTEKANNQFLQ